MEDPAQLDEPCFIVGDAVSGIDNCDLGLYCWDVDPVTLEGECIGLCTGSSEAPMCTPGTTCSTSGEGVLNLCFRMCDPLIQDCPMDDDLCIPYTGGFLCVLDASGDEGQVGDPCMFANACDEGLYCIGAENDPACDQGVGNCCQPFCDITVMNPCTGEGQTCVAWYEEGTAPPGYENVGICGIEV
jgi:hypothetical protein